MIWLVVAVCVAVAGRELYTAYERRQQNRQWTQLLEQLAELRARLEALDAAREALETARRVDRRMLDAGRDAHREHALALADLETAVTELRHEQLERLDLEVSQGTALRGLLAAESEDDRASLLAAYNRCLRAYGLRIRAHHPNAETRGWSESYVLSGEALAWLPRALLGKAATRPGGSVGSGDEALHDLLATLDRVPGGVASIGTFTAVHTQDALVYGLVPDTVTQSAAELTDRLHQLSPDQRRTY